MKLTSLTVSMTLALAVAGASASGCKDKKDGASAADAASSAAPAEGAKAAEAPAAPKEVPLDQFLTKVAPAACKTITSCKNDKVQVVATMPIMLVAGFGTMDKPELAKEMKGVDKSMKDGKRFLPNEDECNTLGGVAMKVLGLEAGALKSKDGKTISYDAKKAAACLDALGTAPEACAKEVKLASEPKMKDMDAFSKELKPSLDAYAKPCEGVITGLVEAGGACEIDLECKGEHAKCKAGKGKAKGTKTCQARKI